MWTSVRRGCCCSCSSLQGLFSESHGGFSQAIAGAIRSQKPTHAGSSSRHPDTPPVVRDMEVAGECRIDAIMRSSAEKESGRYSGHVLFSLSFDDIAEKEQSDEQSTRVLHTTPLKNIFRSNVIHRGPYVVTHRQFARTKSWVLKSIAI